MRTSEKDIGTLTSRYILVHQFFRRAEFALLGSTSITSTSAMVFDALSKTGDIASDISTGFGGMLPIGGRERVGSSWSASLKDEKF